MPGPHIGAYGLFFLSVFFCPDKRVDNKPLLLLRLGVDENIVLNNERAIIDSPLTYLLLEQGKSHAANKIAPTKRYFKI